MYFSGHSGFTSPLVKEIKHIHNVLVVEKLDNDIDPKREF